MRFLATVFAFLGIFTLEGKEEGDAAGVARGLTGPTKGRFGKPTGSVEGERISRYGIEDFLCRRKEEKSLFIFLQNSRACFSLRERGPLRQEQPSK